MNQNDKAFIFYIDNGRKRVYLKDTAGKLSWSGFDFEAVKFNHYKLGLDKASKIQVPDGFRIGFTEIKTVKTYGWV